MSMAAWISGGTTGSIDRQPAAWKPPIATGRPALRNWRARSTARGNWLDCTPTRQISALPPLRLMSAMMRSEPHPRIGLVERLDDDVDVGPKTLAAAAILAQAIERGQGIGRDVRPQPGDRIAVVVVVRRLDQHEVEGRTLHGTAHRGFSPITEPAVRAGRCFSPLDGMLQGHNALCKPYNATAARLCSKLNICGPFAIGLQHVGLYAPFARAIGKVGHEQELIAVCGPSAHRAGPLRRIRQDVRRGRERTRRESHRARTGAGAVSGPELPLPMAGRSAGLLGVRDGRRDPGLVRAGLDRLGAGACGVRLPAVPGHPDLALVRHGGRPDRQPQFALPDAGHLPRRGDGARGAVPGRPRRAGAGVRPGHRDGAGAALRHHAAQPPGRRDHAGRAT